jgi:hypothetical protein
MLAPRNDEPTLTDRLDRKVLVANLAAAVATCKPPQVIGLYGDWGAGKTSLLHQLHFHLVGACPQNTAFESEDTKALYRGSAVVVWFEAWRHQTEAAPVIALLHEIRTNLSLTRKLLDKAGKLAHVTVRSLMDLADITKMIGGVSAERIQKHGEQWEADRLRTILPSHLLRGQLDEAIQHLVGKNKRLVILVDDLDRCEPEAAYKLLEGIKIYLNLPSCVFVLGMNPDVIARAIAKHLKAEGDEKNRDIVAREYLEKLCQDVWHLPALGKPEDFLLICLEPEKLGGPELANRLALFTVAQQTSCLAPNPRRINALANVLRRYYGHAAYEDRKQLPAHAQRADYLMMLTACLYVFHPELYRRVAHLPDFIVEIASWASGTPSGHELFAEDKLRRMRSRSPSQQAGGSPGSEKPVAAFLDPVRGNVFLLQSLIEAAEKSLAPGETTPRKLEAGEFRKYLLH